MEPFFPLHAYVCEKCFLVQLEEFQEPKDIFTDYAYFSSYSASWLKHCKEYTQEMVSRFGFNSSHFIVEIASNDGGLLQFFKEKDIPVLGIDPAANVAKAAESKGIPTLISFFGTNTALKLAALESKADLIIGNNVLAHVPDINDFVQGIKILLKEGGVLTMEFPHLLKLMKENQFDTIYHEHFSYFSFLTVEKIFEKHGMKIFDIQQIPTHGGSLRILACHQDDSSKEIYSGVQEVKKQEKEFGLDSLEPYLCFEKRVQKIKMNLLAQLIQLKKEEKIVVGYGAPAKGNTLLNYCSIKTEFLDYTVDLNPHKQGMFLPSTHIPIYPVEKIKETRPDYILILPWNLKNEIMDQMSFVKEWGAKWILPIPSLEII